MDYVVAGFGIGAVLALIGFALWEMFGNVEEPGTSWLGRTAIGLMLGALVIWAVTGVSLISHIDDSTGSRLVLLTTLVTLVAIGAGSFWYWRADRALAATRPRPAKASPQRAVAPMAAAVGASADIELTEWDSWPEREAAAQANAKPEKAKPAQVASFEPEVAAEAAPVTETESDAVEIDRLEPASVEAIPEPEAPPPAVSEAAVAEAEPEVPSNVRQLRPTALVESSEPIEAEDVLIAETVDLAPPVEAAENAAPAVVVEAVEVVETAPVADLETPDVETDPQDDDEEPLVVESIGAPVAFESSLLADVDGSLADDGGYRSPLLSDLGSDQLEGVGLAKWRPDARLTEQDEKDETPPASAGRRR